MSAADAWAITQPTFCEQCGRENCEGHESLVQTPDKSLPADRLVDAVDVAAEGQAIAATGVQYVVDGIIPNYGMLGMEVAYAKVGKTTFGHALGAAIATGTSFLDRPVQQKRVLVIAPEDPPEYTAWLARHLDVPRGVMTFYRDPIRFDAAGLDTITTTIVNGRYGFALVSSWQAVIAGLVKEENDNAGAVMLVEQAKLAARSTGIPWLIDAHSGKGEDQSDNADPIKALRGASGAAGAADFMLSLRYADGAFSTRRRLSGKGRFVSLERVLLDYDSSTGIYTALGNGRSAVSETTWTQIREAGVLEQWCSVDAIARAIGVVSDSGRVTGAGRRRVREALKGKLVDSRSQSRRGQQTTLYRYPEEHAR
jgi:AAA domain-containing protein